VPRATVLSSASPLVEHHQYWSVVTDLHNVLAHAPIAITMLDGRSTVTRRNPRADVEHSFANWLRLLGTLQGSSHTERKIRGESPLNLQ